MVVLIYGLLHGVVGKYMKESGWKIFKKIKEKAIEQLCQAALYEFRAAMDKESEPVHDRYLLNYKLVQKRDRQMSLLFDGHSRYKAPLQLLAIRREGLADEALLEKLSEEFRDQTDPKKLDW